MIGSLACRDLPSREPSVVELTAIVYGWVSPHGLYMKLVQCLPRCIWAGPAASQQIVMIGSAHASCMVQQAGPKPSPGLRSDGKKHELRREQSLEKSCVGAGVANVVRELLEQPVVGTRLSEDLKLRAL